MELISIRSTVGGNISILDSGKGFELLGKVEGNVEVDEDGLLDLYLLPITSGTLVLPRLLIDFKKGNWKDSIFLRVED
jgi:hypothetical protein